MIRIALTLVLLLSFASTSEARFGDRIRERRIDRAATAIERAGIPSDANGMAHSRELKLYGFPFPLPIQLHVIRGRVIAFRVDAAGRLIEPRVSRIRGAGADVGIGVGAPFSGSMTTEIRSLRGDEYERLTTQRHRTLTVGGFAAAGATPVVKAKFIGKTFGNGMPGTVESTRTVFVGLFARVGLVASTKVVIPRGR